jgi:superfamily II DNA or RNA helicase
MSGMLKNLIKNISSWPELEALIASLPTVHDRGYAFEEFCHAFFILDPVFQFKAVYRQSEIPASILKRLGYPGRKDIGIDGVAISNDNKITTYQAKFRRDRNNTPTLRELSTFFTMSDHADWRITITNANKLPSAVHDRTRQSCILSDRFCQLKPDFFRRLRIWLSKKTIVPTKKITPHKTQREAINAVVKHFKDNSRGQMILPCGTGKTLAAMWIVEKLRGRRILVMVPSLALLSQTLREWAENTSLRPFRYLCLCSDTTVDLGNDSPIEHLYEMDIPVTTDSDVVAEYLKNNTKTTSILFSTYQSSKALSEATLKSGIRFDTAIFDEAHRTAGTQASIWSLALDDKNVPVKRRLFMTATPRIYASHITKKAKDEDVLLCSMDDHTVYGETIYKMSFGQAIERDLITDYKVVVICITDTEVRELVKKGVSVITTDNQEWDANALAKRLALAKALGAYGFKKIFTFHGKVSSAKAFTDTESPYSIKQVIEMVDAKKHKQDEIKYFHVNGTMSSGNRKAHLDEFKEAQIGIMSNARCLTEGVDIPTVDAIAFIDPKKSLIDIVQATGRAMRKAEGKDKGYIFVPVVVGEDEGPEECLESSDFKTVWQILQAMVEQDQRLLDKVSRLRVLQGKGEVGSKEWKTAMAEYTEKFEFFNLPGKIDVAHFTETLYTKAIEVIAKSWDFRYGELIKYKEQFGDCNVPTQWEENKQLGVWVGEQRRFYKKGNLDKNRIKRLEEIGYVWNPIDSQWEEMFIALTEYKEKHGHCNVSSRWAENKQLGTWVANQRKDYRQEKLSNDRIKRLKDIGFEWYLIDSKWEEMFTMLKEYKDRHGDCNVPYDWSENKQLAKWVGRQRGFYRKEKLDKDRIKRLEEIGFVWNPIDSQWKEMFIVLTEYKKKFGNCNVPSQWPENKQLATWASTQRGDYQKGKLSEDRIKRLDGIGFMWNPIDSQWEEMFIALSEYKEKYGHCNVPRQWVENKKLATWIRTQRGEYQKGKLSEDRIKRLEEIGFVWEKLESQWEEMFTMLKEYKDKCGDCNVPKQWAENKQLATWIRTQREEYQKGKLSNDRIKRLEEIGFEWNPFDSRWEEMFIALTEYKEKHGHCNVSSRWAENNQLGTWVHRQRSNYQNKTISKDRIKRLEEIGFVWEKFDSKWKEMLTILKEYKDKHGDCNVPSQWAENKQLGVWVGTQRSSYQKGELDKDRIKRLEDINFEWNIRK